MKKLLLTMFLSFGVCITNQICTNAQDIRFVQVTDTHYASDNAFSEKLLKATVEDINKLKNVSFVVFTGDNINKPNAEYLRDFIKIVNKLNKPYYLTLGNHDVFRNNGMSKHQYMSIVRNNNLLYPTTKMNYVFKKKGFVFIIVDGAKEIIPNSNGYYRQDTLDWLDAKLKKYKDSKVVILQHFPILTEVEVKSHRTYQAEEYLKLLKDHSNVIAVIAGHYHINGEVMQDGIYHITSPTLLKEPYQYKIIDISAIKDFSPMVYTQLKGCEP